MTFLIYISSMMIPLVIFYIVGYAISKKRPVYDVFTIGAKEGMKTVVGIMPTLIGLMVGVGVLRNSGFLDFLGSLLRPVAEILHFPHELIPLSIVRLFSSSAATGLSLDIFKEYGTDSFIGTLTSIMMSCTETVFYTMSVYFLVIQTRLGIRISKTRWTLAGALAATGAGIMASTVIAYLM